MRILHCIPSMLGGGAERQLCYLAAGLVRLGHQVDVVYMLEGPNTARLKASGAKAVLLAISWGSQYAAFVDQANAAGLYNQMKIVAPVGFPENSMIQGYGASASPTRAARWPPALSPQTPIREGSMP